MADTEISNLTEDATPGLDSLLVTVDDPSGTPATRKSTIQSVMDLFEANMTVPSSVSAVYQLQPSEGAFANGDKTKLDGIEAGATADQSAAEIAAMSQDWRGQGAETLIQATAALQAGSGGSALEVEDEGVSLSTAVTKINFVGSGVTATEPVADEITVTIAGGSAPVDSVNGQTGVVVLDADDLDDTATTNKFTSAAEISKLAGIEAGATADQSDAEIETAYNNQVSVVSQAEAEAGTATTVRRWTAQRVAQAIAALGGGAGNVTSGSGAPASTPSAVGDVYIDTTGDVAYIATGTASSADWDQILTNASGPALTATTSVSGDSVPFFDASDSDNAKQTTIANLIADNSIVTLTGTQTLTNKTLTAPTINDPRIAHEYNPQTGTTYTLVAADQSAIITMNNAVANTATIPPNSSVAFPVGTIVTIFQLGAGATTVEGGTGVTVNGVSTGGAAIQNQYGAATIVKIATDTWIMQGDIGAVA